MHRNGHSNSRQLVNDIPKFYYNAAISASLLVFANPGHETQGLRVPAGRISSRSDVDITGILALHVLRLLATFPDWAETLRRGTPRSWVKGVMITASELFPESQRQTNGVGDGLRPQHIRFILLAEDFHENVSNVKDMQVYDGLLPLMKGVALARAANLECSFRTSLVPAS